jgi:hypothetical protein
MTDRTLVTLLVVGGFFVGVLLSKILIRASWLAVGGACCIWIVFLALIAFGGQGSRIESQGWALGFAAFLTIPAILIGSTALKIVGLK